MKQIIFLGRVAEFFEYFFHRKSHPFDLQSVRKKPHMLSYESKFSSHMSNMGNAAKYFMFFTWKSKILVCLCIFHLKNMWVKRALFF